MFREFQVFHAFQVFQVFQAFQVFQVFLKMAYHKPVIKDQSNGMWDRVKLIPVSVTISQDKAVDKDELVSRLLNEAAGILVWAVAGCRMWLEENVPEIGRINRQKE